MLSLNRIPLFIGSRTLIHMNGRVYDYNLGRFLSVDPFIQDPGNSQSMNPYSYIMNNPLAGTDPSGYAPCAASRIQSVCSNMPSSRGGNQEATINANSALDGKIFTAISNGVNNTHSVNVQSNVSTTDIGSQGQNNTNINGEKSPPEKCPNCTNKIWTEDDKTFVSQQIELQSQDLRNPTIPYKSYNEAAQALHDSDLASYFRDLQIEGWAIIDKITFVIKQVSTGFLRGFAKGVFDPVLSEYSTGDVVWHTHPNGSSVWVGDFKSAVGRLATRIYTTGVDLTYIDTRLSSIKTPSSISFKSKRHWKSYRGNYTIRINNVTNNESVIEEYKKGGEY